MAEVHISQPNASANQFALMWEEAEGEFEERTGKRLRTYKASDGPSNLVDQFLAKLAGEDSDDRSDRKRRKATQVVGFILNFVKTMGGLASQAASMVFGPADMCFNAFSFLIDMPKKTGKVYDDLIQLFGDMSATLLEFQVLEKISAKVQIELELVATTHAILIAFVNICGRYIKFLEGGKVHRFTVAIRSVFLDDDCGVLDELKNFKNLARQQSSMIGTVSYRHVLDIEEAIHQYGTYQPQILGHVETLVASEHDRRTEILLQKSLKTIEEKLYIGSSAADASLATLVDTQKDLIDEVCDWLYDTPEYQTWANIKSRKHLLCIAGGPKSGKSFLLAATARRLERLRSTGHAKSPKPWVLYYSFSWNHEKSFENRNPVSLALRVLALQYAQKDYKYAQHLERSLNVPDIQLEDLSKLWTILKFHNIPDTSDRQVHILLGGLDRLNKGMNQEFLNLLAGGENGKIRNLKILVTGAISTFDNLGNSALIVNVSDHNKPGIDHFIANKISKVEILQDNHPNIKRLQTSLLDQLSGKVNSNFVAVERKLSLIVDSINNSKTHDEVLDVLNHDIDNDFQTLMTKRIEDLERNLTSDEIDDLNIMLNWLIYGFSSPTIRELEAILLLHRRSQPVMPLEKRLRNKYSTIIEISDGFAEPIEGLRGFFRCDDRQTRKTSNQQTNISLSIAMDENDRPAVKRFLWDLTQKFSFDDPLFTSLDSNLHRSRIGVNAADAHFSMVDFLFHFLSEDFDADTHSLMRYSMAFLPGHLKELLLLDLPADRKRIICQRLIGFFSDADVIDEKWWMGYRNQLQWLERDTLDVLETWFSTAENLVQPIERRWIRENTGKKGMKGAFWLPITKAIAKKWLRSRKWPRHIEIAFRWVDGYIELSGQTLDSAEQPSTNKTMVNRTALSREPTLLSIEARVHRAAEWVTSVLGLDANSLDVLFYERLALTFMELEKIDVAIEVLNKAVSLDGSDLRIHRHLANAYEQINKHDDAKEHLRKAVENRQLSSHNHEQKKEWIALLRELATAEQKGGNNQAALKYHQQVLEAGAMATDTTVESVGMHNSFWKCFELLYRTGQSERARNMLYGDKEQSKGAACEALCQRLRFRVSSRIGNFIAISYYLSKAVVEARIASVVRAAFQQLVTETGHTRNSLSQAYQLWSASIVFGNSALSNGQEIGLHYLEECFKAINRGLHNPSDEPFESSFRYIRLEVMQQLSLWRSLALVKMSPSHPDFASDWEDFMTTITSALKLSDYSSCKRQETPLTYLCRHYVMNGKHDHARNLMRPDVQDALVVLEGNDAESDGYGFWLLAEALKLCGDDLNALAAWSLVAPKDLEEAIKDDSHSEEHHDAKAIVGPQQSIAILPETPDQKPGKRPGDLSLSCDGGCGAAWTYADDLWTCKFCPDVQFCSKCYELLKNDELHRLICHRQHDFLHVPPWSDAAYQEVGKGHVRVAERLGSNNQAEGHQLKGIKDWLDTIRQDWNIKETMIGSVAF